MTISEMIGQSGLLTLLGMGVVFSFLIILILCMYLLHALVHAVKRDNEEQKETAVIASAPSASAANDDLIIAAIAAAVHDKQLNT